MFNIGDKVGDYEIVTRLKAGGMATLFLARRSGASGFMKHVAIKVVHEHLADDKTFVSMFVDEALLSARIQHPNVVHVEELKQLNGRHFLVMEYVNGCSLAQLLRELSRRGRGVSAELAVWITAQLALGLHAAHELKAADGELEGLVHRDVSPQNVLFAWEGHVKLIDFGVAKARSRAQQTQGGALKGKIRYMSPEQARGKDLDRRSDVYALGILLWEMLTMKRRFPPGDDFSVLDAVRDPENVPPSSHNPDVPEALDAIVLKTLAKDVDERYASAQELRRALAKALPEAFALDAAQLGELLAVTMSDAISAARAALPESVALPASVSIAADDAEILQTMTVSAADIGAFLDSTSATGEIDAARDIPAADYVPATAAVPPTRVSAPSELEAPPPPAVSTADESTYRTPGQKPKTKALALGAAGLFLLGAVGVTAAMSGGDEPLVTPLEAREQGAPPAAALPPSEVAAPSIAVANLPETDIGAPEATADAGAVLDATPDATPAVVPVPTTMRAARRGRRMRRRPSMANTSMMTGGLVDDFGF